MISLVMKANVHIIEIKYSIENSNSTHPNMIVPTPYGIEANHQPRSEPFASVWASVPFLEFWARRRCECWVVSGSVPGTDIGL